MRHFFQIQGSMFLIHEFSWAHIQVLDHLDSFTLWLLNSSLWKPWPIYRWFSQRTKPPFMVGIFQFAMLVITRPGSFYPMDWFVGRKKNTETMGSSREILVIHRVSGCFCPVKPLNIQKKPMADPGRVVERTANVVPGWFIPVNPMWIAAALYVIYIWVNLITTSLLSLTGNIVNKGNHSQTALIQVGEIL